MKAKLRIIYLFLILSTYFIQVHPCLSFQSNSESDSLQSLIKIAFAADGDSVTSKVSKRAGRAPYYLVFDGNGVFLKSIKNPSHKQGRGAGSTVVDLLKEESIKTVIAGKFGDKMIKLLETNKIEYHEHRGFVKEILAIFLKK